MTISPEFAETSALKVLGWLVANEDLLPVFMGASGASVEDLKSGAGSPEFLGAMLDFLLMDDAWVQQMCDATGLGYDMPMQIRQVLPGGELVNWT